jgi:hypothetical protein
MSLDSFFLCFLHAFCRPRLLTVLALGHLALQRFGKFRRMSQIGVVRSPSIHSSEVLQEAICIEAFAAELT